MNRHVGLKVAPHVSKLMSRKMLVVLCRVLAAM